MAPNGGYSGPSSRQEEGLDSLLGDLEFRV